MTLDTSYNDRTAQTSSFQNILEALAPFFLRPQDLFTAYFYHSFWNNMFSSRAFNPQKDIPDLKGKVIFLTGGNTGLGKETLTHLAQHNPAHIYMCAPSQSKAEDAIAEIRKLAPKTSITWVPVDLASFRSISDGVKHFQASSDRLDILINNAGIMAVPNGKTVDGFEIQMGTNFLGTFLLTKLLMPTLLATAKQPNTDVRIIHLTSEAHMMAMPSGLNLDEKKMQKLSPWLAYANSKLANLVGARECARRYPEVTSVSLHPGIVGGTGLWTSYRDSGFIGWMSTRVANLLFSDIPTGAKNSMWAATCPKSELKTGAYYTPIGTKSSGSWNASSKSRDAELWEWAESKIQEKGF